MYQEKPKTSQQKGAPVPEANNVNGNKEDQDFEVDQDSKEDMKEEVKEMIDGVGEAAPLVAVAQKDEVQSSYLWMGLIQVLCSGEYRGKCSKRGQ